MVLWVRSVCPHRPINVAINFDISSRHDRVALCARNEWWKEGATTKYATSKRFSSVVNAREQCSSSKIVWSNFWNGTASEFRYKTKSNQWRWSAHTHAHAFETQIRKRENEKKKWDDVDKCVRWSGNHTEPYVVYQPAQKRWHGMLLKWHKNFVTIFIGAIIRAKRPRAGECVSVCAHVSR